MRGEEGAVGEGEGGGGDSGGGGGGWERCEGGGWAVWGVRGEQERGCGGKGC